MFDGLQLRREVSASLKDGPRVIRVVAVLDQPRQLLKWIRADAVASFGHQTAARMRYVFGTFSTAAGLQSFHSIF